MKRSKQDQFIADGDATRSQYGALCWRAHRGQIEVLLITSRDTGRWVIPKGWPMAELSPNIAAAQEAWEEAGVSGRVSDRPFGIYAYDKIVKLGHSLPCAVAVYPLRVDRLAVEFPERHERRRKWFAVAKAARKVAEPELRAIFLTLAEDPALLLGAPDGPDGPAA
ncbi:MAG: NUDIX hydrolase [Rhodobacteraceae bacterium PARR1]|nr:MAG: NUDIX hydrolase [Rhodobacteraceae bacterium PARR1]